MTYIDNFGSASNPVRDITGTALGIQAIYAEKGASTRTVHYLSEAEIAELDPNITTTESSLLTTPLSQLCDNAWSVDVNPTTGQTLSQNVQGLIASGVATSSPPGHAAYRISTNVPETGNLRAIVLPPDTQQPITTVILSYEINNLEANWTAHNTQNDWLFLYEDATFKLTFNVEILVQVQIPPQAGPSFTVLSSANVNSAKVSPTNYVGDVETFALNFINFINDQGPIFQTGEGDIDSTPVGVPSSLGQLSTGLSDIAATWIQVLAFGFVTLTAAVQPVQGQPTQWQLYLEFEHPQDPAPVPVNAAVPTFPSLVSPQINTVAEAVAGTSISVTGSQFPLPQATEIHVGWLDTISGNVTESLLNWGPAGGTQSQVTIARNGNDGKNLYTAQNLTAGSSYTFSVQDQDFLTETPFTNPPVTISTTSTEQVNLVLSLGVQTWAVGKALLNETGTLSTPATLPSTLAAGVYTLAATLAGTTLARTFLTILAAGTALPPEIHFQGVGIDPTTGQPLPYVVMEFGGSFVLDLTGFSAGEVKLYLDNPSGTLIGSTISTGPASFPATFNWPGDGLLAATVVFAQGADPTQTATAPVIFEEPPK